MFQPISSTSCALCTNQYSSIKVPVIICPNNHTICLPCYHDYIKKDPKCPKCSYKLNGYIPPVPILGAYGSQPNYPNNYYQPNKNFQYAQYGSQGQISRNGNLLKINSIAKQKLKILTVIFSIFFLIFLVGFIVSLVFRLKMETCYFWGRSTCQYLYTDNICQTCYYYNTRICTCNPVAFYQYGGWVAATMVGIFVGGFLFIACGVLAVVFGFVWRKKQNSQQNLNNGYSYNYLGK